jgi:hypothetical protein
LGGAIFLKQFGERRTGTNYLRYLLVENFTNVVVLMHVLGDKHSVPAPLFPPDTRTPEAAYQWVHALTTSVRAESTVAGDGGQQEYLRSIAVPLLEAVRERKLGFVLNVKDPYAWGASLSKYLHLLPRGLPRARPAAPFLRPRFRNWMRKLEEARASKHLSAACRASNRKHRAWLEHHQRFSSRSTIVKFEDLLAHPAAILDDIKSKHGLEQGARRVENIAREVFSADWDHMDIPLLDRDFDAEYFRERRYLQSLTPAMLDTVTRSIDWGLMSSFGYQRI